MKTASEEETPSAEEGKGMDVKGRGLDSTPLTLAVPPSGSSGGAAAEPNEDLDAAATTPSSPMPVTEKETQEQLDDDEDPQQATEEGTIIQSPPAGQMGENEPPSDDPSSPSPPTTSSETQVQQPVTDDPQQTLEEGNTNQPVQIPNDHSARAPENNEDQSTTLPWYKRYQGPLIIALLLIIVGLVAALLAVVVNQNGSGGDNNGGSNKALDAPQPGDPSPVDPSLTSAPTSRPTSTLDTLNLTSAPPSPVGPSLNPMAGQTPTPVEPMKFPTVSPTEPKVPTLDPSWSSVTVNTRPPTIDLSKYGYRYTLITSPSSVGWVSWPQEVDDENFASFDETDGVTSVEECAAKCEEVEAATGAWDVKYEACWCTFVDASQLCKEPCVDEEYVDFSKWPISVSDLDYCEKSVCDEDWFHSEEYCVENVKFDKDACDAKIEVLTSSSSLSPAAVTESPIWSTEPTNYATGAPSVPSFTVSTRPNNQPPTTNQPTNSESFEETSQKLAPLSGEDVFKDETSPQYKAAKWMADEDPIPNLSTGGTGLDIDDPRFEQRYMMALFYYAMDGENWKQNQGWLGEKSECEWFGIKGSSIGCPGGCIERSDLVGDYDKICRIGMGRQNNLYGEIPSELGYLSEMRWFEIQDDYVIGTIPDALGTGWTKLHTFLVGGNFLHGFPQTFENNEMLGTIFIDRNRFNGTFPSVFETLKNLEWLDAENNAFVGELPDGLGNLKSLRILNVNNNNMTGYLPDTWDESNIIEDFEVAGNNFTGPLPFSLGKAKLLKDLRASRNQLTGSIPVSYYNLEDLEELYLDGNKMVGELPQTAEPFYDGLQELSIHSNSFSGRFPVEHFESTVRIKVLSLHSNQLTGTITANICARLDPSLAYTQLIELTVDCDEIVCACCTCYVDGQLLSTTSSPNSSPTNVSSLTTRPTAKKDEWMDENQEFNRPTRAPNSPALDRSDSGIQEQIESTVLQRFASFDSMDENDPRYLALDWILYTDQRQLTTDDDNLFQRYTLALTAFSLDSLAWYACGEHRNLVNAGEEFVVEDCEVQNRGTGQIESHKVWLSSAEECHWYGVICSRSDGVVRGVELVGNDLIGEIPPEISQLRFLQYLALNGNCLFGTIPPEFGKMPELLSLELHGNGLSGDLPLELYDASKIQLLNVAMQFQYSRQCYMSNGTYVNPLYAKGDQANGYNWGLSGHVLESNVTKWANMKGLHFFDNTISGTISDEIGDLKDLVFLRAQNNILGGHLPNNLANLKKLREVFLEKNSILYDIPPRIGDMEDLEVLRLNENEMDMGIPDSLYTLHKLKMLWLHDTVLCNDDGLECVIDSDTGFSGTISTEIGNLKKLSSLLIHNNPFEGTIPTEIGLCENLAILHIHKTNIKGPAPMELCRLRNKNLNNEYNQGVFYADCRSNDKTQDPFFACYCCTDCCDHTTKVCIADD